jgi:dipeptidyl aminopeptidase/acylaminoacyl peptidase
MLPSLRLSRAALLALAALVTAGLVSAQSPAPAKRPLTHADYDLFKAVQLPTLSRDGHYLAYNLLPADADGEFVVRDLVAGGEHRVPRGRGGAGAGAPGAAEARGPAAAGEYEDEDQRRTPPTAPGARQAPAEGVSPLAGAVPQFTPDSKAVVFALPPTKAEIDKARQEKKPPSEFPRPVIAVMDLAGGKITARIERAASFSVVGEGAGLLVYRRQARPADRAEPMKEEKPAEKPAARPAPRTYGTDLVLRNLADGSERTLEDVSEYTITRDARLLVFTVSSKKEEANGVYAVSGLPGGEVTPLLTGKGKYSRLTWDEKQAQLVFFSDRDDAAAEKPKAKLYRWDRRAATKLTAEGKPEKVRLAAASELMTLTPSGIRAGWSVVERGTVSFSADGTRLYVATAPARDEKKEAPAAAGQPNEEKAAFELWHWKDELIQPMQKARAAIDANRSYRAVYDVQGKLFRQLADENFEVTPPVAGDWAVSSDSRPYRKLTGYGATLSDYGLINLRTGEQKALLRAWQWQPNVAHDGKHLAYFDGKDWHAASVATGKAVNLTEKLPVKFAVEDWDMPSEAPAYGFGGWTSDGGHVLLDDRYDVWKVAVDGSGATMLTAGVGRKTQTQLRLTRPTTPAPPGTEEPQRGTDLSKPQLLKAVNEHTRDEGFYRLEPGAGEPKLLVMGARAYGNPVKAKDADTYLLTVSTFYDYPDYYVTGADFREFKRVTDANPKKAEFVWGKAELVRYKNLDGVELSGVLVKPEDFDPHRKYPMIVYIYERLSQSLHRFVAPAAGTSINASYYASNGYLVFMPDIVYTVGAPGQSALKCVLPGVQAVVDKGFVDEKAIGIQGHSWGGYQIAYLVTQTTRFKAAAAGAPVANMTSAYDGIRWGTGLPRQFQYERSQSRIGATLWQAPMKFVENSPIFQADRVQTPLLMLHNDGDDAVPWYQGIEYYLALRRLNKECYLFNYVGEPHGLRKKANQKDYTLRMQQFFDHHLKGAPKPEWMEKGVAYKPREAAPAAPPPGRPGGDD